MIRITFVWSFALMATDASTPEACETRFVPFPDEGGSTR